MATRPQFNLVIADWKDTKALVKRLAEALEPYGIRLQSWDLGTDDTVLTISKKMVTRQAVADELEGPVESVEEMKV